jgi:hypothetical protein
MELIFNLGCIIITGNIHREEVRWTGAKEKAIDFKRKLTLLPNTHYNSIEMF